MKLIQYTTETQIYYRTDQVKSNCNSILFVNTGVNAAIVDGLMILPSQSFEISGNENEINVKTYSIYFSDGFGGTVDTGSLTVIRKIYLSGGSYADGRRPDPKNC